MCDRVTIEIYIIDMLFVVSVIVVCYFQRRTQSYLLCVRYMYEKERFIMPNGSIYVFFLFIVALWLADSLSLALSQHCFVTVAMFE